MKRFNFAISKWQDVQDVEKPIAIAEDVTPIQAEILLRNNANRAIKINQVNKIRRDLRSRRFVYSNDIITFSKEGELLNGQHRLSAIHLEGVTAPCMIGFGYTKENQAAMDCGQKRSLYDVATLSGVAISREGSSIARFVRCQTMVGDIKRQATREEELDFINRHLHKIKETVDLLYPKNLKRDQKTGLNIGNDTGAAFFRALTFFKDAPQKLELVNRLGRALVYEKEGAKLSAIYESSNDSIEISRAKVFRLLKGTFDSLKTVRLGGQDQSGRDLRYKKVEKAISMFVNATDEQPSVIRAESTEMFRLPEEYT